MGGDKQVTIMVLKVDLQCHRCYKKVKKVLCKFPQIQDQVYDEKQNTVTIKVVCCSPEKIKQKIKCKGGDSIKGIEIKVPEKRKPKVPPKPAPPPPKPAPAPAPAPPPTKPAPAPVPVLGYPGGYPDGYPDVPSRNTRCCPNCICFQGRPSGPCLCGCGPPGPPSSYSDYRYDRYYGRPVYDSHSGGGRSYYAAQCDYFSEESSGGCAIM